MEYKNTHTIGDVGEAVAIGEFTKAGLSVSIPLTANLPYDLIVDFSGKLYKIQVKTTEYIRNNKMQFKVVRTNGFKLTKEAYSSDEIDFFFLYCIENNWCGLIHVNDVDTVDLNIRLTEQTNPNQFKVYYSKDYCFDKQIKRLKNEEIIEDNKIIFIPPEQYETCIPGKISREQLKKEIRENPMVTVAKMHGISDAGIRKWCSKLGLPDKISIIRQISDEDWEKI